MKNNEADWLLLTKLAAIDQTNLSAAEQCNK